MDSKSTNEKQVSNYEWPNNKPWIIKALKTLLKEKRKAFYDLDVNAQKHARKKLKNKITECKYMYKDKIESKFHSNDSKGVWED